MPTRIIAICVLLSCSSAFAQLERVWLGYRSNDPSKLVVNWMTTEPGESVVKFGTTAKYGHEVRVANNTTMHHVEIPLAESDGVSHYVVVHDLASAQREAFA